MKKIFLLLLIIVLLQFICLPNSVAQPTLLWEKEFTGKTAKLYSIIFTADEKYVFFDTRESNNLTSAVLYCIDTESGNIVWQTSYYRGGIGGKGYESGIAVSNSLGYVMVAGRKKIYVYKISDGSNVSVLTRSDIKELIGYLILAEDRYLAAYVFGWGVFFIDLKNPEVSWFYRKSFRFGVQPVAVSRDGKVLVLQSIEIGHTAYTSRVISCFTKSESELWSFCPMTYANKDLYVLAVSASYDFKKILVFTVDKKSGEHTLYFLNENGKIVRTITSTDVYSPVISADGTRILGLRNFKLVLLDESFNKIWETSFDIWWKKHKFIYYFYCRSVYARR